MPNPLRFAPMTPYDYKETFDQRRNILACGRLDPQKGFDKLILAFSKVAEAFPEWDLDICGAEMDHNHYAEYIESLIHEHNLDKRVHFLGFRKDVDCIMRSHSIFCLSSKNEGFPNVLSEALASGLACLSFDIITGPSEIIVDGIDGLIVENQNVAALAEGLSYLINDEQLRYSYGLHAIENIKRFERDRVVDKWEHLFETIKDNYSKGL